MRLRVALIACVAACGWAIASSVLGDNTADELGAHYQYVDYDCTVDDNGYQLTHRARLQITSKRGDDYAWLSFWEDDHNRLTDARVIVYDSRGQVVVSKSKKEMLKSCGFGDGTIYDDACYYTGDFSVPSHPYFVEYEWRRKSNSLFYWRGATIESKIPVDSFSYRVTVPENLEFDYFTQGIEVTPTITELGGGKTGYVWQVRNVAAQPQLSFATPACDQPARLIIFPHEFQLGNYLFHGNSWREIGLWYLQLYQDQYLVRPDSLLATNDPVSSLKEIYDEVRRDIRYVAIEVGVGGWQPFEAEATQSRGFGDCKDMSTLLVSRLRNIGIEAYPVYVKTRYRGPLDTLRPRIDFNHVISVALVGADTVWMDPTCDGCPLGDLPLGDEAINVVVGLPSGGMIWKTPGSHPEDNLRIRESSIHIKSDLYCDITCQFSVTGERARYLRRKFRESSGNDEQTLVNRQFAGADKTFKIDSYEVENLSDEYQPMKLLISAHTRRPLNKIGPTVYCTPFLFNGLNPMEKVSLEDRECAIDLAYPDQQIDKITVTWDSGLGIDSVIAPDHDAFDCGSNNYLLSVMPFADSILVELDRTCTAYEVPVAEFEQFAEYRDKLKKSLKQYIKLVSSTH